MKYVAILITAMLCSAVNAVNDLPIFATVERDHFASGTSFTAPSESAQRMWPYYGVKELHIIYQNDIDPDNDGQMNQDIFRTALMLHHDYSGPLCLDIEGELFKGLADMVNKAKHLKSVASAVAILQYAAEICPKAQVGFYGMPWVGVGGPGVLDPTSRAMINDWQEIFNNSKCLFPSIYIGAPATILPLQASDNLNYAALCTSTAKSVAKKGQKVYPLIMARYDMNCPPWALAVCDPVELTANVRQAKASGADGMVLWSADGHHFMRLPSFPVWDANNPNYYLQNRAIKIIGDRAGHEYVDAVHLSALACLRMGLDGMALPAKLEPRSPGPYPTDSWPKPTPPIVATQPQTSPQPEPVAVAAGKPELKTLPGGNVQLFDIAGQSISAPMLPNTTRTDMILEVISAWGATNIDDLLMVVNTPMDHVLVSNDPGMGEIKYVSGGTFENYVLYCPPSKIRKGVVVGPNATVTLRNVLVIGSWQCVELQSGSTVTLENVHAINASTWSRSNRCANGAPSINGECRGDQGGYGAWVDAMRVTILGKCVFHCRPNGDRGSTQYAWRSYGAQIVCDTTAKGRLCLYGADEKDYSARMAGSSGNLLADCEWHGATASFGGGSAGSGISDFSGEVRNPTFDLRSPCRATAQPGVNGLRFTGTIKVNRLPWLSIDSQASNVTSPGAVFVMQ